MSTLEKGASPSTRETKKISTSKVTKTPKKRRTQDQCGLTTESRSEGWTDHPQTKMCPSFVWTVDRWTVNSAEAVIPKAKAKSLKTLHDLRFDLLFPPSSSSSSSCSGLLVSAGRSSEPDSKWRRRAGNKAVDPHAPASLLWSSLMRIQLILNWWWRHVF